MIAAMISKVIGLLYKSPLSNIIGSLGMGYTSLAQNAYMILLMIASFSIPQAVSKLISERIALKDYRNAHKFFKGAMIYAMVIGGVVGLFCLFGAGLIIRIRRMQFRHFRSWLRRFFCPVFLGYSEDIFRHTEI